MASVGGVQDDDESHSDCDNKSVPSLKVKAQKAVTPPYVVKYAYGQFHVNGNKWSAKCNSCQKTLNEKRGVTSAFTK